MVKQTPSIEQRYWNIGLAILCLILFFALFSLMVDEKEDRARERQFKQLIIDYESRYVTMVDGANRLYTSLKECREREG